jgi:hypothetical protein
MIHYRTLNDDSKIYRSINSARRNESNSAELFAFSSRSAALSPHSSPKLRVYSVTPTQLDQDDVSLFIDAHDEAKSIHPKYPPSSSSARNRLEETHSLSLFGFDSSGRSINAHQDMRVSSKWVRYSCPIYINGIKKTVRSL